MLNPNSFYLRLAWYILIGSIAFVSLMPGVSLHHPFISVYINGDWICFLAFTAVAALPLLAWRLRTGIALSLGTAILSVGLQVLRGLISRHATDLQGIAINMLGITAGILLALNIRKLRSLDEQ